MLDNSIIIKGNRDGLNAVINMNSFGDFDDMLESLIEKLSKGRLFYKGCTLKITTELKYINEREFRRLKDVLFDEFLIKDCIFEDSEEKESKPFSGIYEGKTKFIRRTVRSGQVIRYPGNLVILGDVNSGSEVYSGGNVIVLGSLRGYVHAGVGGSRKAVVAAYFMQPQILQIGDVATRAPEDNIKPQYPEIAKVKGDTIVVEPYLPNKFI
ncbi:septum site-determining protein MinC [Clostridium cochlearium]|jgi:septum site-determining protein MinC|uniref:Probable septum site-determining protein MinC n=1 Tax=Clostridium cochlearium TaxID=1494 RepID=A0A240APF8_CLOCO|nr:septum site-determining protein MinC [Clostridium cochlearium]MBV1817205.1 septum site-determining protein MinC [Bacteroidales bacterium MSK.15.36]NSJ91056.1 septum site-determining protein MinC [Coprococcus sp. MSK.21.13]MBE6064662.1 septum site-determining protein MinC [Clostridium cochlearium]MBU5268387.1 septum site-determining protein MinC [Clostridium cochlearium]MCG4571383.1 septum site-determining protein MinC [Clostridium cochlearium]